MQRGTFFLLHFALWRCLPLRAISTSDGKYPAAEVPGYLEFFSADERSSLDSGQRPDRLFVLFARQQLFALSGLGLYGRQYAWPLYRGLRKIFLPDGRTDGEHAAAGAVEAPRYIREFRIPDTDSAHRRSRVT